MKRPIITAIIVLAIVTAAGILALTKMAANKTEPKTEPKNKPVETRVITDEDTEKRTSREVLDDIKNIGPDSNNNNASEERYEISREKYEECGYETDRYLVRYSDGTAEIVDGE